MKERSNWRGREQKEDISPTGLPQVPKEVDLHEEAHV